MGSVSKKQTKNGWRYYATIRLKEGHDTRAFETKTQANEWIAKRETELREGVNLGNNADIRKTKIGQIIDDYIDKTKPNEDSEARCEILKSSFADFSLSEFNSELLHNWLQAIKTSYPVKARIVNGERQPYAPATIRKFYYELLKVLKWHSKIKEYQFNNRPFENNPPPKNWKSPRSRILEDDNGNGISELEALIKKAQKDCRKGNRINLPQFMKWQYFSGCRSGESLQLLWKHLNFDENEPRNCFIVVPKEFQKTRDYESSQDRYIPLYPEFFDFVKTEIINRKRKPNERIFPYWKDSNQLSKIFKRLRERTDLIDTNLVLHDFRHTMVTSIYHNSNLSDNEIGAVVGHSQTSTLARYRAIRVRKLNDKLWDNWKK